MKVKSIALSLIFVFTLTSSTVFGTDANVIQKQSVFPAKTALSNNLIFNNSNMEYCRVDLADRNSNLNVRTWDGEVVSKLRHGTRVFVNEYSGEWARISVKRGRRWVSIGWVDSSYLLC